MNFLAESLAALGSVLLGVAAGLLIEELTLGVLVRLMMAPRPETGRPKEPNHPRGGGKCLR